MLSLNAHLIMTDIQKFAWTIAFSACYLLAGIKASKWIATAIYVTPAGSVTHDSFMSMMTLTISLVITLPGSYLIYKVWEDQ